MLKIPLFAAPTVKFPELRFLVVQTCQNVVQTCAPAEMLGGLLKSQEINVTDSSRQSQSAYPITVPTLSLLTTGNLGRNLFTNRKQIDHAVHVGQYEYSTSRPAL